MSSVAGQRTEKGLSSTFQTLLGGQKVVDAARAVREDIASVDWREWIVELSAWWIRFGLVSKRQSSTNRENTRRQEEEESNSLCSVAVIQQRPQITKYTKTENWFPVLLIWRSCFSSDLSAERSVCQNCHSFAICVVVYWDKTRERERASLWLEIVPTCVKCLDLWLPPIAP